MSAAAKMQTPSPEVMAFYDQIDDLLEAVVLSGAPDDEKREMLSYLVDQAKVVQAMRRWAE